MSELSDRYGSDRPGETDAGADRDITPVPFHAGSDTALTREETYAKIYGAGNDRGPATDGGTSTEGTADGSGSAADDKSDADRPHAGADAAAEPAAPGPDRGPDDQGLADVRSVIESVKAENSELRQEVAGLKAGYDAKLGAMEAKVAEMEARRESDKAEISELRARLEAVQPQRQPTSGRSTDSGERPQSSGAPDTISPADLQGELEAGDESAEAADRTHADMARDHTVAGDARDGNLAQEVSEGPSLSSENILKQATGLAGALGIMPSPLTLVMAAESARREYNELSPEGKYAANNLADSLIAAVGAMTPETAVAAITTITFAPAMHAMARNIIRKIRRED